jgi:translation elongation factor EF-Ts
MSLLQELRNRTGRGYAECQDALKLCNHNLLVAEGYLHYNGLAVSIKPKDGQTREEAYSQWVMNSAQEWAKENNRERKST